ncbi:DUF805 domain-containing protein, partial [Duncaniella freteri]
RLIPQNSMFSNFCHVLKNITFGEALSMFYKRWNDFDGRSTRAEYWYPVLYMFVAGVILGAINQWLGSLFSLINLVPAFAVGIRRMHDIGKSGWWMLICLIPLIGGIWFIVLAATPTKEEKHA